MASSIDGSCERQCSICLNVVLEDKSRGKAELVCGHVFHLDCIGSEFNYKGKMKCPNCRVIEQGKWLSPDDEFNVHRLANIATQLPMSAIDNWVNMHRNGHTWNNTQAEQRAQGMEEQIRLLTHHVIQLRDVITALAPDVRLPPMPTHPAPPSELSPTHDDDDGDDDDNDVIISLGD